MADGRKTEEAAMTAKKERMGRDGMEKSGKSLEKLPDNDNNNNTYKDHCIVIIIRLQAKVKCSTVKITSLKRHQQNSLHWHDRLYSTYWRS